MRQSGEHYTNFGGDERDYSDFTYVDDDSRLGAYLSRSTLDGVCRGGRAHPLTYHLEGQVNDGPA